MVVSGHAVALKEIIYDVNGKAMGECITRSSDGDKESSFCTLYPGYEPSNKIYYGSGTILSVNTYEPQKGDHINKSGRSTDVTSGLITNVNQLVSDKNGREFYIVKTNYASAGGDSGGIVYTDDGKTAGIHLGSKVNDPSLSYYIKANKINKALAVERY
ncbi:hypothetical protein Barb6_02514 [Bacteroidales bacterium Barb6]|nr:hypothetical protein Barb6_02514 [Bacteroidales bacterium Barb6]